MKSCEIRQKFIEYFQKQEHQKVKSSSLVPANDPTLLFTNAGMVQFKEVFLGIEQRSYRRAVSVQRCVRAGGKHNDLENVGYTARHHTFFEMLGNFSFGDYFKREAIQFAWQFLTNTLKISAEKLWVTVYTEDDEAADIWLNEIGVSPARFSRCGEKDNFWSMGDTGPCGPCSEIFYDHGADVPGGPPGSAEEDGDRYVEIWNLVFMQYQRDAQGQLTELPKPSVDTGMGLERIAAVMQGVHSNYDIDIFQHLIRAVLKLCPSETEPRSASLRVVADHIRACAFLIVDGVIPGNEGRGYVLRRIIRRAIRHGHKLGIDVLFLNRLVKPLIEVMGEAYPELEPMQRHVERTLLQEEQQFVRTIDNGLRLLNNEISQLKSTVISGDLAFKLYDTYGFPVDLTADIAREQNLSVDTAGFEQLMEQRRQLSQGLQFKQNYNDSIGLELQSVFCGYGQTQIESNISALLVDGIPTQKLEAGQEAVIILPKTPFYAESGGQVGDTGIIYHDSARFRVTNTVKQAQAIYHIGEVESGVFELKSRVTAQIDEARRDDVRLNHSATHLLHAALKSVVGEHVQQKGSLVDSLRARFDFSHYEGLSQTQLSQVEALVNEKIRQNLDIITEEMTPEEAQNEGAIALFGEKYGESVRVLTMGAFSKELCGGTHARRTGDIGLFKIIGESGIASGVRRIEMVTGKHALAWINKQLLNLNGVGRLLKCDNEAVVEKLSQFLHEVKQKDKELDRVKSKILSQSSGDLLSQVQTVRGVNLLAVKLMGVDMKSLRVTLDQVKSKLPGSVIVLVSINEDKMNVVAGVSKTLLGQVPSAKALVQHLCGRGGGREDMAQGGGNVPADLDEKLRAVATLIECMPGKGALV